MVDSIKNSKHMIKSKDLTETMYHKKELIKTSLLQFVEHFRLLRGVDLPDLTWLSGMVP